MYEKLPPQSVEVEKQLLGSILFDGSIFEDVINFVSVEDFYFEKHRIIFSVFDELYKNKNQISFETVIERLKERKQYDDIGGSLFLMQLTKHFQPTSIKLKFFAKIIHRKAVLRQLKYFAEDLEMKVADIDVDDTETVIQSVQKSVDDIANNFLNKELSQKITATDVDDELEIEMKTFKDKDFLGYKTGFKTLDKLTEGVIIPHIWIVGGYTGTGKTFFTLTMLNSLLKSGARPILFSTENSSTRNLLRMIGCRTGLSEMLLLRGKIENELMLDRIEKVRKDIKHSPMIFYDDVFNTERMSSLITKHKKEVGSNIVIIDYIQNLNLEIPDIYKRMSKVASDIQRMSKELKVAVVGVSQISNAEAMKDNDDLISFKGAGEITAIADVAVWLRRGKERKDLLYALVKKVRHGLGGDVKLDFFTEDNMKNEFCYIKETAEDKQSWS